MDERAPEDARIYLVRAQSERALRKALTDLERLEADDAVKLGKIRRLMVSEEDSDARERRESVRLVTFVVGGAGIGAALGWAMGLSTLATTLIGALALLGGALLTYELRQTRALTRRRTGATLAALDRADPKPRERAKRGIPSLHTPTRRTQAGAVIEVERGARRVQKLLRLAPGISTYGEPSASDGGRGWGTDTRPPLEDDTGAWRSVAVRDSDREKSESRTDAARKPRSLTA